MIEKCIKNSIHCSRQDQVPAPLQSKKARSDHLPEYSRNITVEQPRLSLRNQKPWVFLGWERHSLIVARVRGIYGEHFKNFETTRRCELRFAQSSRAITCSEVLTSSLDLALVGITHGSYLAVRS